MTTIPAATASAGIPVPLLCAVPVVLAGLGFTVAPAPYAVTAAVLAVIGAVFPATLATWGTGLVIALAQLLHPAAAAADLRPYAVLALVHALHVLGGLCLVLPRRGRVQVRALAHPARRWLIVQLIAQPVLAAALFAQQAPLRTILPATAVVVVTAACAVAVVLLLRALAARR
jgi:hypothetical protein